MIVWAAKHWLPTGGWEQANCVIEREDGTAWLGQVWPNGVFHLLDTIEYFEDGQWHDEYPPVPAYPGWQDDVDGVITTWQKHLYPQGG
jgi:hypothetical protein